MIKKHYGTSTQIRDTKQGKGKGKKQQPNADVVMKGLDVALTPEQSDKIWELYDHGWLRSDIAKEVGVPKTRVNHELIVKRRGGGAA